MDSKSNFNILKEMFPSVNENYIKELCDSKLYTGNNDDSEGNLNFLIDYLLKSFNDNKQTTHGASGSASTSVYQSNNFQQEDPLKTKHQTLIKAFPTADPDFLLNLLKENLNDPVKLQEAIESTIFSNTYKKRSNKKLKTSEAPKIIKKSGFHVEDFLAEYPDPFNYFENLERRCNFNEDALRFLKKRFSYHDETYIINAYILFKYNLSTTDSHLAADSIIPTVSYEAKDKSVNDEISFILNKNSIRKKLDELEILRVQDLLLTCECCYSEVKSTDCNNCENFHIFCNACIIKGTNHAISEGKTKVRCFIDCDREILLSTLKAAIPTDLYNSFFKKKQEAELIAAEVEGLEYCPDCQSVQILSEEDKLFKCENEDCMKITCRQCKRLNHLPTKCEDVLNEHSGRIFVQEEMSNALIRKCYKCSKPFIRSTGCNKMTCVCGATQCYICGRPGGGHGKCGCPLYSDNIDGQRVEQKRREAKNKVTENNPELSLKGI